MDCPRGNLSMHTFKKLPTNRPSKAKTTINKANFLYYQFVDYVHKVWNLISKIAIKLQPGFATLWLYLLY